MPARLPLGQPAGTDASGLAPFLPSFSRNPDESRHMDVRKQLLSMAETASLLGLSTDTIRNRVKAGRLDVVRSGYRSVGVTADSIARYTRNLQGGK